MIKILNVANVLIEKEVKKIDLLRKIKIFLLVSTCVIVSTLFVGLMMNKPRLSFIGGSEEGWMSYWGGVIGSIFGVIGAYLVMKTQLDEERKEKKREKEARIILSNTRVTKGAMLIDSYFNKDKKEIFIGIPLANVGATPVTHIKYEIGIMNFEEATSDYSAGGEETRIVNGFNKNTEYNGLDGILTVSPFTLRTGPGFWINLEGEEINGGLRYDESKSKGSIPVVMPGKIESLVIPNEIISLYIFHMVCFMVCPCVDYDDQDPNGGPWPILKIKLNYTDYLDCTHQILFEIHSNNWNFDDYSFELVSKSLD